SVAGDVFGVTVNQKIRPLGRRIMPQRLAEKRRADGPIENHRQTVTVRRPANGRHVEHITVRVAGRFKIQINLTASPESLIIFGAGCLQRILECSDLKAIKKLDRDVQVAWLAKPIVQQLEGAPINIARTNNDVLVAD